MHSKKLTVYFLNRYFINYVIKSPEAELRCCESLTKELRKGLLQNGKKRLKSRLTKKILGTKCLIHPICTAE